MPRSTVFAVATVVVMLSLTGLGLANIGTPKDGSGGITASVGSVLAKKYALGTLLTLNSVTVSRIDCPSCYTSSPTAMSFWVSDGAGHEVRTYWAKYTTFNAKKENWVPRVGTQVSVQGRMDVSDTGVAYVRGKRWAEGAHAGITVKAQDVAASKYASGTYVWLAPVVLKDKTLRADGDWTYSAYDQATGTGFMHLELSLPYRTGGLRVPNNGEVVRPYGMLWRDYAFGYWEIHPVRCWAPGECAPLVAATVRNTP